MALVSQIDMFPKRIKNIFTPGVRTSDTEAKRPQGKSSMNDMMHIAYTKKMRHCC